MATQLVMKRVKQQQYVAKVHDLNKSGMVS